jgi:tetratricopeptide (TPR) repeat protein
VNDSSPIAPDEVVDLLDRLVAKSLIIFDDSTYRYRCLETVRQYAREQQLASLDAGAKDARNNHASYFYDLLTGMKSSSSSTASLNEIEADSENLKQATDWWAMQNEGEQALEMTSVLHSYWFARGLLKEGSRRARVVLDGRPGIRTAAYADALYCYGDLTMHLGNFAEGKAAFEESLAIGQEINDKEVQALALSGLAGIHQDHLLDYERSKKYRLQALALVDDHPNGEMYAARHYYNLGDLTMKNHPDLQTDRKRDVFLEAKAYLEKSKQLSDKQGNSELTYFLLTGLGNVSLNLGEVVSAKTYAVDGMRYCIDAGYPLGQVSNLGLLAFCAAEIGSLETAVTLISGCQQIMERTGFVPGVHEQAVSYQLMESCLQELGDKKYQRAAVRAQSLSPADLLDLAEKEIGV